MAQTPSLTSNRPGISESEGLVVPGAFQIESGVTFAAFTDTVERHQQVDAPEATIRFGLTPRVEIFAVAPSAFWNHASLGGFSATASGASDLSANLKLGLLNEAQHGLTLTAAAGVSFPVGDDAFSSGGYDPSLRLLWSRSLPHDFGLSGNLDVSSVTSGDGRVTSSAASVGVAHPLVASMSWFAELFGSFADGDSQWQLDGGVAVLTSDDFQIDVSAGRTLKRGPSAWFVAGGITLRHRR